MNTKSANCTGLTRREFLAVTGMGAAAAVLVNGSVAAFGSETAGPLHLSLDGTWKLYYFPQGKHEIAAPQQLKIAGLRPIDATVPGDAPLELSKTGELPADLYFAENMRKLRPYELYEWWYQREFAAPKDTAGRSLELRFHGVDCLATYWLNGIKIGESDNAFIEHRFDVTGKLSTAAPNLLAVRLRSPEIEAAAKEYDPAYGDGLETNQEGRWIRKPAHSWGWNIMPRAVSAGLWRTVELIVHASHEIREMYFATTSASEENAELAVSFDVATDLALLPNLRLRLRGECGECRFEHVHKMEFVAGRMAFTVSKPKLWWPRGYGDANLYKVTTELLQGDAVLASRIDTIGIRKLELLRTDITTQEHPGQFLFKVNSVPILVKGSNWVPADAFHSRDAALYDRKLALFADLQCNMLRSWGGGVYEDHAFFDICDRSGIMVWQDFAMACGVYPNDAVFQETLRNEAISVVRKLRNHPSIALWSGDNECDEAYDWIGQDPIHNLLTRKVLPEVIFQCDPYRSFLPSSPYMSPAFMATRDRSTMPEDHLWDTRDYFKSSYYKDHTHHFVSEVGFDGCPGLSSLKRMLDAQHLWPPKGNPQWTLHSTSWIGNEVENGVIVDEANEFYAGIPDKVEDFVFASQTSQAEAFKFLVEMTRLKKWRRTGVVWWNVIDGWPLLSDSIVDYFFTKKLAYFYVRRVQQPVVLMVDELENWHCRVVMGNDSCRDANGRYRIWDADTGATVLEGDYAAKANENLEVGKVPAFHSDKKLWLMEWTVDGKRFVNHYLLGTPPFLPSQYRAWLPKISALAGDFDPANVGA